MSTASLVSTRRSATQLAVALMLACVTGRFAAAAEPAAPTLPDKVIHAGILTTSPPFAYRDGDQYKGMTYDILEAIAKSGGFEVDPSPMAFTAMIPAMQAHQVDVAVAGFFVTDARKKVIDFSQPFFSEGSILAVPVDSPIKDYEGLRGKTIVSQQGSAALAVAQRLAPQYGATVKPFAENSTMELAVRSGNADAVFFDSAIVQYRIAQEGAHPAFRTVGDIMNPTDIAFALPQDSKWTAVLNAGLERLRASGDLLRIEARYVSR